MKTALIILGVVFGLVAGAAAEDVSVSVNADKVAGRIDENIYGHFLEHIFHSVNGGLWGELVWQRSFEGGSKGGKWFAEGGDLVQKTHSDNVRLLFGRREWADYEFTLEAKKIGGGEGFLILFREASKDDFYWCNLGGWGNTLHALERGVKGGSRWGRVGETKAGKIKTGKWYAIRVRCEGPRFQVFLDGDKVLDFTDKTHPHLKGRVGVGTWRTSARYRKLKVTSLDGRVLFEGLPRLPSDANVASGWQAYGQGRFQWTRENPLNCDYCQLVEPDGGEAGLQQTPFCIRSGEKYHGSIWARGQAKGLVVRLVDGRKKLAEAALPAPEADWQELAFTLTPSAAADNATLQVGVMGKGKVWIDQVSLMSGSARKAGGFRPDLLKAIADLRPPVIRWPGGCFASFYRWKDGVGPQHKRVKYPRVIWDDQDANSFGTDEFIAMCRRVGAEPLIVINVGMHDARQKRDDYCREARDWVEYCNGPATSKWGKLRAANGHPKPYGVKYWEIDNEIWRLQPDDYAGVVKQFVPAMKKVDPSIVIIACGSGQLGRIWPKGDEAVIAKCADIVDYLSVHHYESPNRYADGPAAAEKFWRSLGRRIARSSNPKVKLYVSEWNAQSTDWRTGLYCGGILNVFERCGDFLTLGGPALFLRHASARSWDNAFINFDRRRWFPAPNYVVMKLWRDHYAPNRLAVEGDLGGLSAVATKSADGKTVYVKAVNPTDKAATLTVQIKGDFQPGKVSMRIIAPDSLSARNSLEEPDAVRPAAGSASRDGRKIRIELPRWSAGVATVGRK